MIRLSDVDHWCGVWPAGQDKPPPEVMAARDRHVAEWLARGCTPAPTRQRRTARPPAEAGPPQNAVAPPADKPPPPAIPDALTVTEAVAAHLRHAKAYSTNDDGTPATEYAETVSSLRPVVHLYVLLPAAKLSPLKLKAVRQLMVAGYEHTEYGKQAALSRGVINRRVARIKRAFTWLVGEELAPVRVACPRRRQWAGGRQDHGEGAAPARRARRGRLGRADAAAHAAPCRRPHRLHGRGRLPPVGGVPPDALRARPHGRRVVLRPAKHKTRHRGKRRIIAVGAFIKIECPACGRRGRPRVLSSPDGRLCGACAEDAARCGVMEPRTRNECHGAEEPLFSPAAQRAELYAAWRAGRVSKVQPSQESRKKKAPKKLPGPVYTPAALAHAVAGTCKRGGLQHWSPYRVRHLFGAMAREAGGLDGAQAALGHATPLMADHSPKAHLEDGQHPQGGRGGVRAPRQGVGLAARLQAVAPGDGQEERGGAARRRG